MSESIIQKMPEKWGKRFYPLLENQSRYLVLCGGRGSGKSEFAARKIFWRCVEERDHRFLVLRKVRSRCRESVIEVFRRLLIAHGVPFEETKTERTLRFFGNEVLFDGMDDPQKIKSFAGLTGLWIEETTEFTEQDFLGVDLILREPTPFYKQIILSFNPEEVLAPWLKKRFFDSIDPDATVMNSTIDDNPIKEVRDAYRARLDLIQDKVARDIYRYGLWALAKGVIFAWDVVDASKIPTHPDAVFYGGDFGYSVDPAALIKIYRKANEYWLEEILYQTGLTNQDLARRIKLDPRVDIKAPSYWDSAEPKSIEELYRESINVLPSVKGQDSVRAGIDFLRSLKIHIVAGSENIIGEARSYRYKTDKNGESLPDPIDYKDHCFIAGTIIETRRGLVPIEDVKVTDDVLTRQGWGRVVSGGMTAGNAPVLTAYFSNGIQLTGTADHPIWVDGKGFIPLDTMRYGDIIETWQHNALFTTELHIGDIPNQVPRLTETTTGQATIGSTERDICIGKYGKTFTGKYLTGIISTTWTAIQGIILSAISRLRNLQNIFLSNCGTGRQTENTLSVFGPWPINGIVLQMAGNGTGGTQRKGWKNASPWRRLAINAENLLRFPRFLRLSLASARINVNQHGDGQAEKITKLGHAPGVAGNSLSINTNLRNFVPVHVLRVVPESKKRPVYNLTVSDVPEFYANGILVHNCMSATRYGIVTHMRGVQEAGVFWSKDSVY